MNTLYRWSSIVLLAALILGGWRSTVQPSVEVDGAPADPEQAMRLIVKVTRPNSIAGGIIFHRVGNHLFILTAEHVVGLGTNVKVEFEFLRGISVDATVARRNRDLDVAVLLIELNASNNFLADSISFDQIGFVDDFEEHYKAAVASNQAYLVRPMGFPEGSEWHYPLDPPQVRGVVGEIITIEYSECVGGYSGGGLFNDRWQLVGMVTKKPGLTCQAISFDRIYKELIDQWRLGVSLKPIDPDSSETNSLGTLVIGAYPGGHLFVDGESKIERLTTIVELPLPAKSHNVRVVNPAYGEWEREVTVPPGGKTERFIVNFIKIQRENR